MFLICKLHFRNFSARHPITPFLKILVVLIGLTCVPITITSLNFDLKNVSSLVIALFTKSTSVYMLLPTVSIFLAMLFLMRTFFPLPTYHLQLQPPCLHHLPFPLTNLKMLHMPLRCFLTFVQDLSVVLVSNCPWIIFHIWSFTNSFEVIWHKINH